MFEIEDKDGTVDVVSESELYMLLHKHRHYAIVYWFNSNRDVVIVFKDKMYTATMLEEVVNENCGV